MTLYKTWIPPDIDKHGIDIPGKFFYIRIGMGEVGMLPHISRLFFLLHISN